MSNTLIMNKTALIVGASSGVGRALVVEMAQNGWDLAIAARDERDLIAIANDARLRFQVDVFPLTVDLERLDANEVLDVAQQKLGSIGCVLCPAGVVFEQDEGAPPEDAISRSARVNYEGIAQIAACALRRQQELKLFVLGVFSSIAAFVPRGKNAAYAASKAALEIFALGMRHAQSQGDAHGGVCVQIFSLGYVDTGLSFGKKLMLPVAEPPFVAKKVVKLLGVRSGRIYIPSFWRWVVLVLQRMPWFVFRRLRF